MSIRTLVSSTVVLVHFFLAIHFKSQSRIGMGDRAHTFFIAYTCPLSSLDGTLVLVRFFFILEITEFTEEF